MQNTLIHGCVLWLLVFVIDTYHNNFVHIRKDVDFNASKLTREVDKLISNKFPRFSCALQINEKSIPFLLYKDIWHHCQILHFNAKLETTFIPEFVIFFKAAPIDGCITSFRSLLWL